MWNSVFLVFLAIGGSMAMRVFRDCDMKLCDRDFPRLFMVAAPTEKQLKLLCSPMQKWYECQKDVVKNCTGKSLEEWSTSDNETLASFSELQLNLQRLSDDICDEESLLHEGYVSSVNCFNEMIGRTKRSCENEAVAIHEAFVESQKLLGVVKNRMEEAADLDCMILPSITACITTELREKCGEIAGATLVNILKHIQFVSIGWPKRSRCTAEQVDIMRTTYLDSMGFEEQKKSWYSQVFNSKK